MTRLLGSALLWLALVAPFAQAAPAVPLADDAVLEARVEGLAAQLRCLVCQNQSLADSHAALAIDLKNQVREQLRSGRDEAQVIDYMTQRYGDFVLYKPPLKATTALLWSGPVLLVLFGLALAWRTLFGSRRALPRGSPLTTAAASVSSRSLDLHAAQPPADWFSACGVPQGSAAAPPLQALRDPPLSD
jgi:cytochrome c-type biogenesis protein CcmH